MKKSLFTLIVVTLAIIIGSVILFSGAGTKSTNPTPMSSPQGHEYYWLTTCPHCKIVADFLENWSGKDKIQITKYEASSNENGQKLMQRGQSCGLDQQSIGAVPLLVTPDGKCYLGDTPIIDYFKSLNL